MGRSMKHETKFNTKNLLKVEEKMSEKASDIYGVLVGGGISALLLCLGVAAVIFALRW